MPRVQTSPFDPLAPSTHPNSMFHEPCHANHPLPWLNHAALPRAICRRVSMHHSRLTCVFSIKVHFYEYAFPSADRIIFAPSFPTSLSPRLILANHATPVLHHSLCHLASTVLANSHG